MKELNPLDARNMIFC